MKELFNQIWELALPYQDKRDDAGHAETSLKYATKLVTLENGNEDVVIPAIILHDVGWSQFPEERRLIIFDRDAKEEDRREVQLEHQIEGVKLAMKILRKVNYPDELTDEILEIISQHDTRKGFISKNEGIVRDADKLWRTSKEGFTVSEARSKKSEAERLKKLEEGLNKPDYFYSETARQMALADLESWIQQSGKMRLEIDKNTPITDELMQQISSKSKEYSIVILRRNPKRDGSEVDKIIWEHSRNNFTLLANGLLSSIFSVTDDSELSGISIFNASLDETKKIMNEDPGIKSGVFVYEAHTCHSIPGSYLSDSRKTRLILWP